MRRNCRHTLDKDLYVVKAVKIKDTNENDQSFIDEVKHLKRLIHINVVQYQTSWIERVS